MKILIIGVPRSGTTSLVTGISKQSYFWINEPYYYDYPEKRFFKYPLEELNKYKKIVVKTLTHQVPKENKSLNPVDFALEFSSYFDKIILLDRLSWKLHLESYINLRKNIQNRIEHNKSIGVDINNDHEGKFNTHGNWVSKSITKKDIKWAYEKKLDSDLKKQKKDIHDISKKLNIPITYYENLYNKDRVISLEIINNWNLKNINQFQLLNFLDPKKKYLKNID